ncbi:MAG TPA: hypothetical protein ENJ00_09795 [Phycisphaerales bacterium]|nr:hypothetical protein [Phycisphaerales bacterium]
MNETTKLLAVFRVEQRLRGLRSRLDAAERFLSEQETQLAKNAQQLESLASQLRQVTASIKESEDEIAKIDARVEKLREEMNTARTNKEYQAFLVEVNGLKIERGRVEEEVLAHMEQAEAIKSEIEKLEQDRTERDSVRKVAKKDRDTRHKEIESKVKELTAERDELAAEVQPRILSDLRRLLREREDDAMASIEVIDRKRHEISCSSCMMTLPIEVLSTLLSGRLTLCSNCGCFLYIDDDAVEALQPASSKR